MTMARAFRLPKPLVNSLRLMAKEEGKTMTQIVIEAITRTTKGFVEGKNGEGREKGTTPTKQYALGHETIRESEGKNALTRANVDDFEMLLRKLLEGFLYD